jgi:F420-non-reducing hydrogenase iron-sulfur subunit
VGGCHPGDCHYQSGNFKARRRVAILRNVLDQFGIPKDRVWLRWISASEGQMFAETIREITEATRKMGPAEFRLGWDV